MFLQFLKQIAAIGSFALLMLGAPTVKPISPQGCSDCTISNDYWGSDGCYYAEGGSLCCWGPYMGCGIVACPGQPGLYYNPCNC